MLSLCCKEIASAGHRADTNDLKVGKTKRRRPFSKTRRPREHEASMTVRCFFGSDVKKKGMEQKSRVPRLIFIACFDGRRY
jgi:hypothetical protein